VDIKLVASLQFWSKVLIKKSTLFDTFYISSSYSTVGIYLCV